MPTEFNPKPPASEVWQRGPVPGFPPLLQPVVHALLQVVEEMETHASSLTHEQLWARPFGLASVGFHLLHIAGATDRLFTYARAEVLTPEQVTYVRAEGTPLGDDVSAAQLVATTSRTLHNALERVRTTELDTLLDIRHIGKARLATTVIGLLFHAAEHASRHAGQVVTTVKVVREIGGESVG